MTFNEIIAILQAGPSSKTPLALLGLIADLAKAADSIESIEITDADWMALDLDKRRGLLAGMMAFTLLTAGEMIKRK